MAWTALDALATSTEEHNPDVIEAIEIVRSVVDAANVAYLNRADVTVDADPDLRAAFFRFPHRAEPQIRVEVRQGDGYTYLKAPLGEYHGYVVDEDFKAFIEGVLSGGLLRVVRVRGGAPVEARLQLRQTSGELKQLSRRVRYLALWRFAVPMLRERRERQSLSYDRMPAIGSAD